MRLARRLPLQDCLLCRGHSAGARLCGWCRRDLPRCAKGLDRARLAGRCGLDALAVRFDYRPPLDELLTRYKYHAELALAPALAALLPPAPRPAGARPWLMPVPADPRRLRARGYDHLALLARPYARRHGLVLLNARRSQPASAQAALGRRARQRNLRHAFRVPALAPGAPVLLLDDVLTTGATLAELAAACRRAGAGWVGAVVLARTPAGRELRPDC